MNALITWSGQLQVGYAPIDRQHQELIRIANELYVAMKAGQGRQVLQRLFIDLANYTVWHFDTEEALMQEHHYSNVDPHKHEHAELRRTVAEMSERARGGTLDVTLETMNFLRQWLSHHIQYTDKDLGSFLASRGKRQIMPAAG